VGSGKSTLMDLFCLFGLSEGLRVRRQHFHEFSLSTQQALHALADRPDASRRHVLACVAEAAARDADVLCLDEFQVTNVADAAILKELLRLLAELHVCVVCTTNRPPEDLYKEGLHRERYIPALVQQLRDSFLVVPVQGTDYREELHQAEVARRHHGSDGDPAAGQAVVDAEPNAQVIGSVFFEGGCSDAALQEALAGEGLPQLSPGQVKISWGRSLPVPAVGGGLACFHRLLCYASITWRRSHLQHRHRYRDIQWSGSRSYGLYTCHPSKVGKHGSGSSGCREVPRNQLAC